MKTERVILSFVAVLIGLLAAGAAFFFYQMTRNSPQLPTNTSLTRSVTPTKTAENESLVVIKPENETIVSDDTIKIEGKTIKDALVVLISENDEQVVKASGNGSFSIETTLAEGMNNLYITAFLPDGKETKIVRTISYSDEDF
jgi:hypothetical protein